MTTPHATVPQLSAQDIARFWSRVDTSGDCWLWIAGRFNTGYGYFILGGKLIGAHRIAYQIANGPIPSGMLICHQCDNPGCVRPEHLFLGTVRDNARDAMRKGRLATGDRNGARLHPERVARGDRSAARRHPESLRRGEENNKSKLTEADVREIRALAAQGMPGPRLAERFGVSNQAIWFIVTRKNWKHVE